MFKKMTKDEEVADATIEKLVREALADYAHDAWSGWMKYLFSKCLIFPAEMVRTISGAAAAKTFKKSYKCHKEKNK